MQGGGDVERRVKVYVVLVQEPPGTVPHPIRTSHSTSSGFLHYPLVIILHY